MTATSPRILIVEDEILIAMAIEDSLRDAGYDVYGPVRSGEEAIGAVAANPPDVLLLDVTLIGRMDGITAANECRRTWDGPIVFHTAYSDARIRERIAAIPNSYFLAKPSHPSDIIRAVKMALARRAGP